MKAPKVESDARKRILATACDLFYRNGYRATGINELIEKSGVAKATFYAHFPSKEDLALAYMKAMNEAESEAVLRGIAKHERAYDKLLGLYEYTIAWAKEQDYRGCAYLNISSEIPNHAHPARREGAQHYRNVRALVGRLMKELKAERGDAWKGRDADRLADEFTLLFAGALAMSQVYHDPQPIREALSASKRLLA
jgi:AcrR family transcriptional regulator